MELATTVSEIWAPSNGSTKSAWAWHSTLKYGVFQWRVLQIFGRKSQAILFKTLPCSIFGIWLKLLAGKPVNCNETTKFNALYNCNWNVEIVADAGNDKKSSQHGRPQSWNQSEGFRLWKSTQAGKKAEKDARIGTWLTTQQRHHNYNWLDWDYMYLH